MRKKEGGVWVEVKKNRGGEGKEGMEWRMRGKNRKLDPNTRPV